MAKRLFCGYSLIRSPLEHFLQQIGGLLSLGRSVRLGQDPVKVLLGHIVHLEDSFNSLSVQLVRNILQVLLFGKSEYRNLLQQLAAFCFSWKERSEGEQLSENAAYSPDID